ncbi:TPA: phage integrase SAM-like domain-containing protein [Pseudomonas aeruginosa]
MSFADWYGGQIDILTYVCHVQILRFLAKQDAEVEVATLCSYYGAIRKFLEFAELRAYALERSFSLADINRDFIDSYLRHLSTLGATKNTQRINFSHIKSVLIALSRRGIIDIVAHGDNKTFPLNPFPNSNKFKKGANPLSTREKKPLVIALRSAIQPIWDDGHPLTCELISYCLLAVALHTGRNTTPLLEMTPNCLKPHPKDGNSFLVLWKRRGHNSNKVILRRESESQTTIESMPAIRHSTERLIRHVITRTAPIRAQHEAFSERIWIYYSRESARSGDPRLLTPTMLAASIKSLVENYDLTDDEGLPLKVNISRLRKTFANRIFEIMDGDLAGTARALGSSPRVTDTSYLSATIESKKNWRFMGEVLVDELLNKTIGATYHHTPVAKCTDNKSSRYTPKQDGVCMSFLNCVRCRFLVITAEDLYKLFSFYYRIYNERSRMSKRRWMKELSHIPRLIENYIVAEGLRRGVFSQNEVNEAKARAKATPHPFWSADTIPTLEVIA